MAVHFPNGSRHFPKRLKTDSSAVQMCEISGTAGMQKLVGSSTFFHCDNGCDRSCKPLLPSSLGVPE